jgi:hypothetical protein
MNIHASEPLFAWACLDDCPTLATLRDFLAAIPDQPLLGGLAAARGKGRDDFPVARLWRVVLLTIALRHVSFNACLAELHRSPPLCRLIDITAEDNIPNPWNLSRFLDVLGREPHLSNLRQVFDALAGAVPGLGRDCAGDSTTLNARAKANARAAAAEAAQGLPQPSGGRKKYTDEEGRVVKVIEWFGYKLHLIVDVQHELAVAYRISDTKTGDGEELPALLAQAKANLGECRLRRPAFDKAADTEAVHELLHDAGVKPLIQMRALWKDESERPLPGAATRCTWCMTRRARCSATTPSATRRGGTRWPISVTRRTAARSSTAARRGTRAGTAPARRSATPAATTG